MRNPDDHKTTATNADLLLIMLKPEDQKTTATNLDLLLIMRNLKTKKHLQTIIQIYFYIMPYPENHIKQLKQMQIYL